MAYKRHVSHAFLDGLQQIDPYLGILYSFSGSRHINGGHWRYDKDPISAHILGVNGYLNILSCFYTAQIKYLSGLRIGNNTDTSLNIFGL